MLLFQLGLVLKLCIYIMTDEQRQASLIILPPIILGYDELIDEGQGNSDKKQKLFHPISHENLDDRHHHGPHESQHVYKKQRNCNGKKNSRLIDRY